MKKWIAGALAFLFLLGLAAPALALDAGLSRVAIGANLDDAQIAQVYADFGLERGSVQEITVTNQDERAYLEGLVSENKIGSVALSCVYITTLEPGSGLSISTKHINWCTEQMYANALTTAGITDARVVVTAPFDVSGTAALTGIYRAYESITGTTLSDLAKTIGAMSDDDVRTEIRKIAEQYNVVISDSQVEQLLTLCRRLEKLDVNALQSKLVTLAETVQKANAAKETVSAIGEKISNFFSSVGNFFSNLFGKK